MTDSSVRRSGVFGRSRSVAIGPSYRIAPLSLAAEMSSQSRSSSNRISSVCCPCSGARAGAGGVSLNCTGAATIWYVNALVVDVGDGVSVRLDLRIVQGFLRCRQRRPHAGFVCERLAPVLEVLACDRLRDERARLGGVGDQIARRHEAFVGGELRQADPLAEAGPEAIGLKEDQLDPPVVTRLVAIDQRVDRQTGRRARNPVDVEEVGHRDRRGDRPHRLRQQ